MMKNRRGSSLLIVLMILAVTMIFATVTVGFMVTENNLKTDIGISLYDFDAPLNMIYYSYPADFKS